MIKVVRMHRYLVAAAEHTVGGTQNPYMRILHVSEFEFNQLFRLDHLSETIHTFGLVHKELLVRMCGLMDSFTRRWYRTMQQQQTL